jgi:HSP20 family protein
MWRPLSENGELTIGSNRLALDIHEDNDNYTVVTEFPGVKADDIHVKVEGDMLHIEGEIPEQTVEKEDSKVVVQERRYGRYSRSVRLPKPVDTDKVDANYKDGVLTLTLPIKEEVKPRAIPVKVKAK